MTLLYVILWALYPARPVLWLKATLLWLISVLARTLTNNDMIAWLEENPRHPKGLRLVEGSVALVEASPAVSPKSSTTTIFFFYCRIFGPAHPGAALACGKFRKGRPAPGRRPGGSGRSRARRIAKVDDDDDFLLSTAGFSARRILAPPWLAGNSETETCLSLSFQSAETRRRAQNPKLSMSCQPPVLLRQSLCLSPHAKGDSGRRAVVKLIASAACVVFLAFAAACGRASEAEAPAAATSFAPTEFVPTPDVEAASIPTVNGIPTVPVTAPIPAIDTVAESVPAYRMPAEYNTSHTAVQITKEEETLQLEAYALGGVWLIGYGHLMLEGEKDVITEEEAEAFLVKDLVWCESAIERYITVPVTLNEFSAIVAFCYNVGSGKTRGSSIVKRLNIADRPGAANGFLLWNRMNGVVMQALAKRRARERTLFLTP